MVKFFSYFSIRYNENGIFYFPVKTMKTKNWALFALKQSIVPVETFYNVIILKIFNISTVSGKPLRLIKK